MYTADKSVDRLRTMVETRKKHVAHATSQLEAGSLSKEDFDFIVEDLHSEINKLELDINERERFAPGTLLFDPETGISYRRRPGYGYSTLLMDGSLGFEDFAPKVVTITWVPEKDS